MKLEIIVRDLEKIHKHVEIKQYIFESMNHQRNHGENLKMPTIK
jgi:hypothetical protein